MDSGLWSLDSEFWILVLDPILLKAYDTNTADSAGDLAAVVARVVDLVWLVLAGDNDVLLLHPHPLCHQHYHQLVRYYN